MLRLVILSALLLVSVANARPEETTIVALEDKESTTIKTETETPAVEIKTTNSAIEITSTQSAVQSSSSTENNSLEENSHESSENTDDNGSNESPLIPISPITPPKRKVLYINQQQSGKLNVHLELNDVSLIVIPNKKDPQLSLLNLLLRSAQKSNLKHNEEKKKEENMKINLQQHNNNQDDDYSQKYKMDNYMHASVNEPSIESRAPYRVDISSTLGQQPVVDIMNNGKFQAHAEYARSPMVKLLKPISTQQSHGRKFKRSIDTSYLRFNPDVLDDSSISQHNNGSDDEEQELINSLESNQNIDGVENQEDIDNGGDGFVLLGAVEDCGPGRRRNSYMICVAIEE